jgi:microcystin-dependent protein
MSQPYIGEIRLFAGNFAPIDWKFCDGSLYSISEYDALFSLIGTTYGGDGVTTFAVPDLRGRVPIHQGAGFVIGQMGGVETVTLTTNQIPAHTHALLASTGGTASNDPTGRVLSVGGADIYTPFYTAAAPDQPGLTGSSQPHTNMQPFMAIYYIIATSGVYPSRS